MSSSPGGTEPATRTDSQSSLCNPAVSQTTWRAGPPTFSLAIMRTIFIGYCRLPIANRKSAMSSVFHSEDGIRIILVANLVNPFSLAFTHVESIWTIDYDAVDGTHILVGMNNSKRHDHGLWEVLANN